MESLNNLYNSVVYYFNGQSNLTGEQNQENQSNQKKLDDNQEVEECKINTQNIEQQQQQQLLAKSQLFQAKEEENKQETDKLTQQLIYSGFTNSNLSANDINLNKFLDDRHQDLQEKIANLQKQLELSQQQLELSQQQIEELKNQNQQKDQDLQKLKDLYSKSQKYIADIKPLNDKIVEIQSVGDQQIQKQSQSNNISDNNNLCRDGNGLNNMVLDINPNQDLVQSDQDQQEAQKLFQNKLSNLFSQDGSIDKDSLQLENQEKQEIILCLYQFLFQEEQQNLELKNILKNECLQQQEKLQVQLKDKNEIITKQHNVIQKLKQYNQQLEQQLKLSNNNQGVNEKKDLFYEENENYMIQQCIIEDQKLIEQQIKKKNQQQGNQKELDQLNLQDPYAEIDQNVQILNNNQHDSCKDNRN